MCTHDAYIFCSMSVFIFLFLYFFGCGLCLPAAVLRGLSLSVRYNAIEWNLIALKCFFSAVLLFYGRVFTISHWGAPHSHVPWHVHTCHMGHIYWHEPRPSTRMVHGWGGRNLYYMAYAMYWQHMHGWKAPYVHWWWSQVATIGHSTTSHGPAVSQHASHVVRLLVPLNETLSP